MTCAKTDQPDMTILIHIQYRQKNLLLILQKLILKVKYKNFS